MYQKYNYDKIVCEMQALEKKKSLQQQIEKDDNQLAKAVNTFNKLRWEIQQKQAKIDQLEEQLEKLEEQLDPTEILTEYNAKKDAYSRIQQENEQQSNFQESLKHMVETRRNIVRQIKKQCTLLQNKLSNQKKQMQIEERSVQTYNKLFKQKDEQDIFQELQHAEKNHVQKQVEEGLSEFEDKQKFELIM